MKKRASKLSDNAKIRAEINTLKKSVLNLKFQKATGQLEKTSELKKLKKKIAAYLTKINQNMSSKNA